MTIESESTSISEAYHLLLKEGEVRPDPDQAALVAALDALQKDLVEYQKHQASFSNGWSISRLFGRAKQAPRVQGLYIVGGVGRGKSMLMDLFFETVPIVAKRRVHFHEFMADVHARLKEWRAMDAKERVERAGRSAGDDPIPPTAAALREEASLLCFDEMQVTDIADAMVLGRLFNGLMEAGVVIVATSNRVPDDLYKDGLNRQLFLPFIDQLKAALDVFSLDGPTDYRLDRMRGVQTYYTPVNDEATNALRHAFFKMTDRNIDDADQVPTGELVVNGRAVFVPKSCKGVAVFSFKRLCATALGAQDYLSIARNYHTLIIVGIPMMGPDKRNEAVRFRTLIDALYEHGVKLFCSAAASPEALYTEGDGAFEFERTVSRLMEMQSDDYLKRGHGLLEGAA